MTHPNLPQLQALLPGAELLPDVLDGDLNARQIVNTRGAAHDGEPGPTLPRTTSPVSVFVAFTTSPKDPVPIFSVIRYFCMLPARKFP